MPGDLLVAEEHSVDTRPAAAPVTRSAQPWRRRAAEPGSRSWRLWWSCSASCSSREHSSARHPPMGLHGQLQHRRLLLDAPRLFLLPRELGADDLGGLPGRRGPAERRLVRADRGRLGNLAVHPSRRGSCRGRARDVGSARCVPVDTPTLGLLLGVRLGRRGLVFRVGLLRQRRASRHRSRIRVDAVGHACAVLPMAVDLVVASAVGAIMLWQAVTAMYPGQVIALAYVAVVWVAFWQWVDRPRLREYLVPLIAAGLTVALRAPRGYPLLPAGCVRHGDPDGRVSLQPAPPRHIALRLRLARASQLHQHALVLPSRDGARPGCLGSLSRSNRRSGPGAGHPRVGARDAVLPLVHALAEPARPGSQPIHDERLQGVPVARFGAHRCCGCGPRPDATSESERPPRRPAHRSSGAVVAIMLVPAVQRPLLPWRSGFQSGACWSSPLPCPWQPPVG